MDIKDLNTATDITDTPVVVKKKKSKGGRPKGYHLACGVCKHEEKVRIEMDYVHYIPIKEICSRYKIEEQTLQCHVRAMKLVDKRDRKHFLQHILDHYRGDKISADTAVEACKQLDRLEHKVDVGMNPTQIVVQYGWGKPLGANSTGGETTITRDSNLVESKEGVGIDGRSSDIKDGLLPVADAGKVPPESTKI